MKGFTILELMIVVAIIGILSAITIPAVRDYQDRSDPMTTYNKDGKRSLPEQQTRDSRTCIVSGLDFKLNESDEVVCIPKGQKDVMDTSKCTVYVNNGGNGDICVR